MFSWKDFKNLDILKFAYYPDFQKKKKMKWCNQNQDKGNWYSFCLLKDYFIHLLELLLHFPWTHGTIHLLNSHACQVPVDIQVERLATIIDKMSMTHGTVRSGKHWQSYIKTKWAANRPPLNNYIFTFYNHSFKENAGRSDTWCLIFNNFIKMLRA